VDQQQYTATHKNWGFMSEAIQATKKIQEYIATEYNNSSPKECPDEITLNGSNFASVQQIESDSYCNILITMKANDLLKSYYVKLQPSCSSDVIDADVKNWSVMSNADKFNTYMGNVPTNGQLSRVFGEFSAPYNDTLYHSDPVNNNHGDYTVCTGFSS
jgi:hypothetical protein